MYYIVHLGEKMSRHYASGEAIPLYFLLASHVRRTVGNSSWETPCPYHDLSSFHSTSCPPAHGKSSRYKARPFSEAAMNRLERTSHFCLCRGVMNVYIPWLHLAHISSRKIISLLFRVIITSQTASLRIHFSLLPLLEVECHWRGINQQCV
jgi:hypothetical protein